jgi:hypothetical protein
MAKSTRTCDVIVFPRHDKRLRPPANNWIFRIVENNEALVATLAVILESYKSVIAGNPVCDAEVIRQVEQVLRIAQDVKWNAIR